MLEMFKMELLALIYESCFFLSRFGEANVEWTFGSCSGHLIRSNDWSFDRSRDRKWIC